MPLTFLWVPVNATASPGAEEISELEKRKLHKLTKDLSSPNLISAQVEWILSFNLVNKLNIQPTGNVTQLKASWNIHDVSWIWWGSNPLYLILREWATQEILAKCEEVVRIPVPSKMPLDAFIS